MAFTSKGARWKIPAEKFQPPEPGTVPGSFLLKHSKVDKHKTEAARCIGPGKPKPIRPSFDSKRPHLGVKQKVFQRKLHPKLLQPRSQPGFLPAWKKSQRNVPFGSLTNRFSKGQAISEERQKQGVPKAPSLQHPPGRKRAQTASSQQFPGPGDHDITVKPMRKEIARTFGKGGSRSVARLSAQTPPDWTRASSQFSQAPTPSSIPQSRFAHGYEFDEEKQVWVPAKPDLPVLSGAKDECVGPGHYTPGVMSCPSSRGGSAWSKKSSKGRGGHYAMKRLTSNSLFDSQSLEQLQVGSGTGPAQGSRSRSLEGTSGSCTTAFSSIRSDTGDTGPGPGSYNYHVPNLTRLYGRPSAWIMSTSQQHNPHYGSRAHEPGPGAYGKLIDRPDTAPAISVSKYKRTTSGTSLGFGTSASRNGQQNQNSAPVAAYTFKSTLADSKGTTFSRGAGRTNHGSFVQLPRDSDHPDLEYDGEDSDEDDPRPLRLYANVDKEDLLSGGPSVRPVTAPSSQSVDPVLRIMNQRATGRAGMQRPNTSEPLGFNGSAVRFREKQEEAGAPASTVKQQKRSLLDDEPGQSSWYFKPRQFKSLVPATSNPPPGSYEISELKQPIRVNPKGEGFGSQAPRFRALKSANLSGNLGPPVSEFGQVVEHNASPNYPPPAPPRGLGVSTGSVQEEEQQEDEPHGFGNSGPRFPPPRVCVGGNYDVTTRLDTPTYNLSYGYELPGLKTLAAKILDLGFSENCFDLSQSVSVLEKQVQDQHNHSMRSLSNHNESQFFDEGVHEGPSSARMNPFCISPPMSPLIIEEDEDHFDHADEAGTSQHYWDPGDSVSEHVRRSWSSDHFIPDWGSSVSTEIHRSSKRRLVPSLPKIKMKRFRNVLARCKVSQLLDVMRITLNANLPSTDMVEVQGTSRPVGS
eukprot:gene874-387_t